MISRNGRPASHTMRLGGDRNPSGFSEWVSESLIRC